MRTINQPPEWEPLPKYSLVAIFAFFALIIAFGSGCASKRIPPEEPEYKKFQVERMVGKCWAFDKIEKESKVADGEYCGVLYQTRPELGLTYYCIRLPSHLGSHHYHIGENCRWVWYD